MWKRSLNPKNYDSNTNKNASACAHMSLQLLHNQHSMKCFAEVEIIWLISRGFLLHSIRLQWMLPPPSTMSDGQRWHERSVSAAFETFSHCHCITLKWLEEISWIHICKSTQRPTSGDSHCDDQLFPPREEHSVLKLLNALGILLVRSFHINYICDIDYWVLSGKIRIWRPNKTKFKIFEKCQCIEMKQCVWEISRATTVALPYRVARDSTAIIIVLKLHVFHFRTILSTHNHSTRTLRCDYPIFFIIILYSSWCGFLRSLNLCFIISSTWKKNQVGK